MFFEESNINPAVPRTIMLVLAVGAVLSFSTTMNTMQGSVAEGPQERIEVESENSYLKAEIEKLKQQIEELSALLAGSGSSLSDR